MPAISCSDVSVSVREPAQAASGYVTRTILGPVSLEITQRYTSIVGANGSGKSTFLQLLNGLVLPSTGRVRVHELDTRTHGHRVRQMVGFLFTDPGAQLVMPTPLEDVDLSLRKSMKNKTERKQRAMAVLDELGIADLANRSVYELSGGQRQLVALATVLAVQPRVLVMDEPTTLLDLANRELLREIVDTLLRRHELCIVASSHDLEFAHDAQDSIVFDGGQVYARGTPAQVVSAYRTLIGDRSAQRKNPEER